MRNLISYADFFTMAAIALFTCVGFTTPNFYRQLARKRITVALCLAIWLTAFAMISPIVFDVDVFGHNFGHFGWDDQAARCDVRHEESVVGEGRAQNKVIYISGVIIPFLVICTR